MATVQQLMQDLADGRVGLAKVIEDFETRAWPSEPEVTEAQRRGVHDLNPADPDSFDWVDLTPGLPDITRRLLARARARALRIGNPA